MLWFALSTEILRKKYVPNLQRKARKKKNFDENCRTGKKIKKTHSGIDLDGTRVLWYMKGTNELEIKIPKTYVDAEIE